MMTEGVISRVEALGRAQKQPAMHGKLIVTWRNGDPIAPVIFSIIDADAAKDDIVTRISHFIFLLIFLLIWILLKTWTLLRSHLSKLYRLM